MKDIIKNSIRLLMFTSIALLFFSCSEEDPKFKKYVYPMPEVTEIHPSAGYVTERVTIFGTNFGDRVEPLKISFGGIAAENILSCKNNCIVVEVPVGALSGEIYLQLWTNPEISIGTFTVFTTPTLVSIASDNTEFGPTVAVPGDIVTITGSGFGTEKSAVSVSFNGTPAEIISLEDMEIVAVTPEGYQSGAILVTINGLTLTGTGLINPNATGDITMFYLKNFKRPFTQIEYTSGQEGNRSMATPTDWIVNDQAKSYVNKDADVSAGRVGGMFPTANALGMQTGWGGSGSAKEIKNGKMYQTITLTPGVYSLEVVCVENNVSANNVYIAVAAGEGIPDVEQIHNAIAYTKFTQGVGSSDPSFTEVINFTLEQDTEISIGFVADFSDNKYFKISDIKLILVEKK